MRTRQQFTPAAGSPDMTDNQKGMIRSIMDSFKIGNCTALDLCVLAAANHVSTRPDDRSQDRFYDTVIKLWEDIEGLTLTIGRVEILRYLLLPIEQAPSTRILESTAMPLRYKHNVDGYLRKHQEG